ncbi:hypothetical protein BO78DRAFT_206392 [Aspergillus sclerotiicarbonarius CBS 121057]|uniref:Uncharacterized protein n=1 Tax=Aspergillus sclerotiicarbonarius (strain CBS 121057 / IBT 28362) TaxID=1448318 RepID=A0A319FAT4_ASPSB|nr:hypothetical protein BO78DRAFT_206392 [Aspergillus sclerotiicarbonarius CBS 121057]
MALPVVCLISFFYKMAKDRLRFYCLKQQGCQCFPGIRMYCCQGGSASSSGVPVWVRLAK